MLFREENIFKPGTANSNPGPEITSGLEKLINEYIEEEVAHKVHGEPSFAALGSSMLPTTQLDNISRILLNYLQFNSFTSEGKRDHRYLLLNKEDAKCLRLLF